MGCPHRLLQFLVYEKLEIQKGSTVEMREGKKKSLYFWGIFFVHFLITVGI